MREIIHRLVLCYLPSEEELLRELNQEYQALEAGKTGEDNSGDMKEE